MQRRVERADDVLAHQDFHVLDVVLREGLVVEGHAFHSIEPDGHIALPTRVARSEERKRNAVDHAVADRDRITLGLTDTFEELVRHPVHRLGHARHGVRGEDPRRDVRIEDVLQRG